MTLARQGEGVNTWPWTEDLLDDLEAAVSPERLSTYLTAAGGDRKRALQLYTWNTEMSAAFYGPLQGLEIALARATQRRRHDLWLHSRSASGCRCSGPAAAWTRMAAGRTTR